MIKPDINGIQARVNLWKEYFRDKPAPFQQHMLYILQQMTADADWLLQQLDEKTRNEKGGLWSRIKRLFLRY